MGITIATVSSAGLVGIDGYLVTVECDLSGGLPTFDIVGLPDASVREARDRVRAAVKNCGYDFPLSRVTINLAPADTKKEGPIYDLPILLGILAAGGQIGMLPPQSVFAGELSLDGGLRPVAGALSMALAAEQAGCTQIFLPVGNAQEASFAEQMTIYPVENVGQLLAHLSGRAVIEPYVKAYEEPTEDFSLDFSHVMGQENVKRALEIAAAGGHNVLLSGSPGSGKSMMAKRIGSILPPMTKEERLEVIRVYSVLGEGAQAAGMAGRPFRSPHHTTSAASLAGGGSTRLPKPGEISLAHNGVLFLDELPEFRKDALEVLRQPLEDGMVTISRVAGHVTYPSRFMLVCAMNPCKCGWYGHPSGKCKCSEDAVRRYRSRISGPLLDRVDLQLEVQPVKYQELASRAPAESSAEIRKRVVAAREVQKKRFAGTDVSCNAYIPPAMMGEVCRLEEAAAKMIEAAFERLGMTARSYDRVLRVARTIADLAGVEIIAASHIAEAIQYRFADRRA